MVCFPVNCWQLPIKTSLGLRLGFKLSSAPNSQNDNQPCLSTELKVLHRLSHGEGTLQQQLSRPDSNLSSH